jgi:spore coat protein JB
MARYGLRSLVLMSLNASGVARRAAIIKAPQTWVKAHLLSKTLKELQAMEHTMPEQFYTMLLELQEVDFVLVELTLYLDTHPRDTQAIQQYNQCAQKRMHLAGRFEQHFGPLKSFGQSFTRQPWQWIDTPWPWQV